MRIIGKRLRPDLSEVCLQLSLSTPDDLAHLEAASGDWRIVDGVLEGEYRENGGGMIYTKRSFDGDVMMDFYGMLVPPCTNDLNFVFKTEGYDYAKGDAGRGYIAGLNGWWDGKAGIERYPGLMPSAQTPLFKAQPGIWYHIQAGYAQGHCFIFVDGQLIVELQDDTPQELALLGRVGFGTYCSRARYRDLTVYALRWEPLAPKYTPAF